MSGRLFFSKEPELEFSWARKMCAAVEVLQNITSADLTGAGIFYLILTEAKKTGLNLMLKFWCAETDEERDLIQQQAEADGLGHCDMMEEKKGNRTGYNAGEKRF